MGRPKRQKSSPAPKPFNKKYKIAQIDSLFNQSSDSEGESTDYFEAIDSDISILRSPPITPPTIYLKQI